MPYGYFDQSTIDKCHHSKFNFVFVFFCFFLFSRSGMFSVEYPTVLPSHMNMSFLTFFFHFFLETQFKAYVICRHRMEFCHSQSKIFCPDMRERIQPPNLRKSSVKPTALYPAPPAAATRPTLADSPRTHYLIHSVTTIEQLTRQEKAETSRRATA